MNTVLITSVGSVSATGVIFCMEPVRSQIRIVGTNSLANVPANFLCDRVYLVPETAEAGAYETSLHRIIEREQPAIVLAGRDEELWVLARLRDKNHPSSTSYLVPPEALIPVFNDKLETASFARRHGLPFAETAYEADEARALLSRHGWPLIAKPRWVGHASKDIWLIRNEQEFESALAVKKFLFQEFLPSEGLLQSINKWRDKSGIPWFWSVKDTRPQADLVLGQDGVVISSCTTMEHSDGAFTQEACLLDNDRMSDVAEAYAKILGGLGHLGPFNLQGKLLADGRYVPFELNARFAGTVIARAYLGRNQVIDTLEHWLSIVRPVDPWQASLVGRFPAFLTFEKSWLDELTQTGQWTRPHPCG